MAHSFSHRVAGLTCQSLVLALFAVGLSAGPAAAGTAGVDFLPVGTGPESTLPGPTALSTADFNNDGNPDLLVGSDEDSRFSIELGLGNGDFVPGPTPTVSALSTAIAGVADDFNKDGNQDVVVVGDGGTLRFYSGDGTGRLTARGDWWTVFDDYRYDPRDLVSGDFDHDGNLDVAVLGSSNAVIPLYGNGNGDFGYRSGKNALTQPEGAYLWLEPRAMAEGDFNGDGRQDLAVAQERGDGATILLGSVFANPGSFEYQPRPANVMGDGPVDVAVGEFNSDGEQDLVVANRDTDSVTILLNQGLGKYGTGVNSPHIPVGDQPSSVAVGDFNRDGHQDIAVATRGSNGVTILLGDGTGQFAPAATSPESVGNAPTSIAVGTFNRDGAEDLAVTEHDDNTLSVLLNDIVPPTTLLASPLPTNTADNTPTFQFSSNEAGARFECRIDAAPFAACTSPYTSAALADGRHTFAVRAIDLAGNVESSPPTWTFNVDTVAPQTTFNSRPPIYTTDNTPTFGFASSEAGSRFQCRIDTASFAACTSPYTAAALPDGKHTFAVRAIDLAGNVDASPAVADFKVDTVAPQTTFTSRPPTYTADNTPTFGFTSSEAGSRFQCRIDTASFAACTSPYTAAALPDGPHTFTVRAIDLAGNIDATPAVADFKVDTVAPETTFTSRPPSETADNTPTFAFASSEPGSRFQCRIDTASFAACSSPYTTAQLPDGKHTFAVRAIDLAGNIDPTPATWGFNVQTSP